MAMVGPPSAWSARTASLVATTGSSPVAAPKEPSRGFCWVRRKATPADSGEPAKAGEAATERAKHQRVVDENAQLLALPRATKPHGHRAPTCVIIYPSQSCWRQISAFLILASGINRRRGS